jgi:hypothetical protein
VKTTWKHVFHGAALAQLVESSKFTALNRVEGTEGLYLVNHDRRILLKYDADDVDGRYSFTLNLSERKQLDSAETLSPGGVHIALVCGYTTVCSLTLGELKQLVSWSAPGGQGLTVLVEEGASMTVSGPLGQLPYKVPHSGAGGFPGKVLA